MWLRDKKLYRVESKDSRARYYDGKGIYAEDTETRVDFDLPSPDLGSHVENHVDWGNRTATPFISAYSKKRTAVAEACRRMRCGKEEVMVTVMNIKGTETWSDSRVEYRNLRKLAKKLGVTIPNYAWRNSKFEYIILHHVPESAIVDRFPVSDV
jgi:hypothetical protein